MELELNRDPDYTSYHGNKYWFEKMQCLTLRGKVNPLKVVDNVIYGHDGDRWKALTGEIYEVYIKFKKTI